MLITRYYYLHMMFIDIVCGLQLAGLEVEVAALHLGLLRHRRQPVVEAANNRHVPKTEKSCY